MRSLYKTSNRPCTRDNQSQGSGVVVKAAEGIIKAAEFVFVIRLFVTVFSDMYDMLKPLQISPLSIKTCWRLYAVFKLTLY